MSKITLTEGMDGQSLHIDTAETNIEVGLSGDELENLREELNGATNSNGIDDVYAERNLLALTLASVTEAPAGWQPAPDADPMEWAVVWIESPEGQVTWHVPIELAQSSKLEGDGYEYDGHDRDTKDQRLTDWAWKHYKNPEQ